ncbi:unnamed protein product [Strongylus vulgaris]|uniref:Uncharacterized protein n=1 Tax=Strongylus vulgaris TaxID=40348 RepID=A0A3P7J7E3_STRVU|nr:unnamed protein product [Strongylus vulgaris]
MANNDRVGSIASFKPLTFVDFWVLNSEFELRKAQLREQTETLR